MSTIKKQILASMSDLHTSADTISARFCFSPDFIGFKGHFPGKPVLPGVCKVQAVLCMIEKNNRKTPVLQEIVSAKFFSPAGVNEELVFTLRQSQEGAETILIKALVTRGDTKIADIHLRILLETK